MPATVNDLLQGKPDAVTARPEDLLHSALERMLTYDFSQLPVVDDSHRPIAIVTHESIVRTMTTFRIQLDGVRVSDAMERPVELCRRDDDLLEALDKLQRASAVLVVDTHQALTGLITSHDTTVYFRKRTQDIMLAQDIELLLKDFVQASFQSGSDTLDEEAFITAASEISPSNKELRGSFKKALNLYLGEKVPATKLSATDADRLFEEHLYRKDAPKTIDRLTFWHYIEVLFQESRWARYAPAFSIPGDAVRGLLNNVRETRNDLAHLREVSQRQHDELLLCKDWLARHSDAVKKLFAPTVVAQETETQDSPVASDPPESELGSTDDDSGDESRYQALASYLLNVPRSQDKASVTFQQIEDIIKEKLPSSAREYRSWWANTPVGHTQSKQWLDVGWRVASVSLVEQTATFTRNKQRELAYKNFFTSLSKDVAASGAYASKLPTPAGQSWFTVAPTPHASPRVAFLNFSFARNQQFRVELYIDTLDAQKNKRIFDALMAHKQSIEKSMGEPLSWERLDSRRASRIAYYHPGSIDDPEPSLVALRAKAIDTLRRLHEAILPQLAILTERAN